MGSSFSCCAPQSFKIALEFGARSMQCVGEDFDESRLMKNLLVSQLNSNHSKEFRKLLLQKKQMSPLSDYHELVKYLPNTLEEYVLINNGQNVLKYREYLKRNSAQAKDILNERVSVLYSKSAVRVQKNNNLFLIKLSESNDSEVILDPENHQNGKLKYDISSIPLDELNLLSNSFRYVEYLDLNSLPEEYRKNRLRLILLAKYMIEVEKHGLTLFPFIFSGSINSTPSLNISDLPETVWDIDQNYEIILRNTVAARKLCSPDECEYIDLVMKFKPQILNYYEAIEATKDTFRRCTEEESMSNSEIEQVQKPVAHLLHFNNSSGNNNGTTVGLSNNINNNNGGKKADSPFGTNIATTEQITRCSDSEMTDSEIGCALTPIKKSTFSVNASYISISYHDKTQRECDSNDEAIFEPVKTPASNTNINSNLITGPYNNSSGRLGNSVNIGEETNNEKSNGEFSILDGKTRITCKMGNGFITFTEIIEMEVVKVLQYKDQDVFLSPFFIAILGLRYMPDNSVRHLTAQEKESLIYDLNFHGPIKKDVEHRSNMNLSTSNATPKVDSGNSENLNSGDNEDKKKDNTPLATLLYKFDGSVYRVETGKNIKEGETEEKCNGTDSQLSYHSSTDSTGTSTTLYQVANDDNEFIETLGDYENNEEGPISSRELPNKNEGFFSSDDSVQLTIKNYLCNID